MFLKLKYLRRKKNFIFFKNLGFNKNKIRFFLEKIFFVNWMFEIEIK